MRRLTSSHGVSLVREHYCAAGRRARTSGKSTSAANGAVEAGRIMWTPSHDRAASSRMAAFARVASERSGRDLTRCRPLFSIWPDLHQWSISEVGPFWQTVSDFCDIKWLKRGNETAYTPPRMSVGDERRAGVLMTQAGWFKGAQLNFAHNLMPAPTDAEVIVSVSERPDLPSRKMTGKQLRSSVARCARALQTAGIGKGDRVAGVMTNSQEAIVCMLAVTAIGAIWSSCSPDFGVAGVSDRLGQVSPKLVLFSLGYSYGGRWHDCRQLALDVLACLPGSPLGVGVPYWPDDEGRASDPDPLSPMDLPTPLVPYAHFLGDRLRDDGRASGGSSSGGDDVIHFEPTAFDHPVFIMFSSGTTGLPKCMVHGAGGTLLQQKKELVLHCDIKAGDKMLFFSTLGWMMWNWAAAVLSVEAAALVAFDGSPGHPDLPSLWRVTAREGVTHLGASPKYFGACKQNGVIPAEDCLPDGGLGALRTVLSTGSPLLPEHYDWIYNAVKRDVHLASISGGTDILGCFALGNPMLPVRAGHLQCLGLGMDVCAYRSKEEGSGKQGIGDAESVEKTEGGSQVCSKGEMGELVCRSPFPSMPVFFWGDPCGSKYRSAYFEAFDGEEVWAHGDYIQITEEEGVVISGRSDAVLNPGGVRIGTSEIYRQVEMIPEVADSVAVGLRLDGDVQVVLFLKLALPLDTGAEPSSQTAFCAPPEELERKVKTTIRHNLTARHVPSHVVIVGDIPYTRSGKKVEVAVAKAINGDAVNNVSALANPNSLQQFRDAGEALRRLIPLPPPPSATVLSSRL